MSASSPQALVEMVMARKTVKEISEALGATPSAIRQRIGRARVQGLIPADYILASAVPRGRKRPKGGASKRAIMTRHRRGDFVVGGGTIQMVTGLPVHVQDWLIDQIPKDATLIDVVRAFILDAYNDEVQQ